MTTILLEKILSALTTLLSNIKTKLTTIKTNLDDLIVVKTASGSIANFETDIVKPLISCNIEILPKQAAGTPSPSNPLPISGTDTVTVLQTEKNLFDPSISSNINTSIKAWGANDTNIVAFLNTLKKGTYKLSYKIKVDEINGSGTDSYGIIIAPSSGAHINTRATESNVSVGSIFERNATITIGEGTTFTNVWFYTGRSPSTSADSCTFYDFQLEVGSTATTYEPYSAITKTVSLPQTVYGGEVDVVSGSGRKLTDTYTVSGEETSVQILQGTNNNGYRIEILLAGATNKYSGLLSSISENANILNANTWQINKFCTYSGRLYITVPDDYDTVEKALAYLKDGVFEYELATPTPITLANPIDLTAKAGVNNVFGDTDWNTTVQYLKKYKED